MRDLKEILTSLIQLRCVNDPDRGVRPSEECVNGFKRILGENNFRYREIVSNGFHSFMSIRGSGKPIIMLMAHYDVVPPGPSWTKKPFEPIEENGRLYGRGALDDLSNIAVMLRVSQEIDEILREVRGTVIICFTGDEEIGGSNGALVIRELLLREGLRPDYLINGDGGGLVIINRRRNAFRLSVKIKPRILRVRGREINRRYELQSMYRHSAYFLSGADIHPLIRLARDIESENLLLSGLRGSFVKSNVLPEYVEADMVVEDGSGEEVSVDINLTRLVLSLIPLTRLLIEPDFPSVYGVTATPNVYKFDGVYHQIDIDIRAPLGLSGRVKLDKYVSIILKEYLPEALYEIHGGNGYLDTPRDSILVKRALEILERLRLKPVVAEKAGASDSRYFSPLGIQSIDIGPIGGGAHGPDEYVELWSLNVLERFYIEIIKTLLGEKS
ncbi:MAG: M20/M25/M40 family metallo-hydrolase [Sulfolobales archaeon]